MSRGAWRGTVLVIGAHGFLGRIVAAALRRHGQRVLAGVRTPAPGATGERRCDLVAMTAPEQWHAALEGVDAVVNVAGILRESGTQTFNAVHVHGPLALARACVTRGIGCFIQISALGDPRDGEFVASKHRFDAALLQLPLRAVVLRPSVVYATAGSYGGTSLLRALAALPFGAWVPGDGHWLLQPVAAGDLGELVARALEVDAAGTFEVGGPAPISLRGYQAEWRRWLRIPCARSVGVPLWLVALQVRVAERFGHGPLGATIWRMLQRGNITAPDAARRLQESFGFTPRGLSAVLSARPSHVQDRQHAQLYFLAPLLCAALACLWIISGVVGLSASDATIAASAPAWPAPRLAPTLARIGGGGDLVFALWLVSGWQRRWALAGMAACVAGYTILFGVWTPMSWLLPLGGLAKNLVVLPAIALLWVLCDRR